MSYDEQYQNEQAYSSCFQKHLNDIISLFKRKKFNEKKIIEIGCGKGYFLEMLRDNGFDAVGFDPAYEGGKTYVVKDYYSDKYSYLNADLIILRHTLEHIQEPLKFLHSIASAAKHDAQIFIEVPNFEWIIKKSAFWDISHEHCNYFTFSSLANIFQNSEQDLLFNGQYMYLIADLKNLQNQAFSDNVMISSLKLSKRIDFYKKFVCNHQGLLVWGAAAKGVNFVNLTDYHNEYISCLVDINPKKQGQYIAKTGHRIISPAQIDEMMGRDILIMNDNYYYEIKNQLSEIQVKDTGLTLYTLGEIL